MRNKQKEIEQRFGVFIGVQNDARTKAILITEMNRSLQEQNPQIRLAFSFCCDL